MSKVCSNCNSTVDDSLAFCPTCGSQLPEAETTVTPSQPANPNAQIINTEVAMAKMNDVAGQVSAKSKDFMEKIKTDKEFQKKAGMIAGCAFGAIVLLIIISNLLFPSSTSVVKSYIKGMEKHKSNLVVKTFHPKYIEEFEDSYLKYLDADDIQEYFDNVFEEDEENDIETTYELDKEYKALSKSKVEDIADELDDNYDIPAKKVKNVRKYNLKVKTNNDGDKETTKSEVYAVKISGKWYIFPGLID